MTVVENDESKEVRQYWALQAQPSKSTLEMICRKPEEETLIPRRLAGLTSHLERNERGPRPEDLDGEDFLQIYVEGEALLATPRRTLRKYIP